MEFIDLAAQQRRIRGRIEDRIRKVLDHGQYINGPEVSELEGRLKEYVGVGHAVACSSGTDALLLALMAYGVGRGDAVLTSPFTFIATAEVISLLGATPVFVDIDPVTFNLDAEKLEGTLLALRGRPAGFTPIPPGVLGGKIRPRGVLAVDLFGLPARYEKICELAAKHGLFVVEDGAQSFGAEHMGKKACAWGDSACTSFFPAKPLGCYGDGGMIFTDDGVLAETLFSMREHGKGSDKYENVRIGMNGRLDTLQAAILLAKFEVFPQEMGLRQDVAQRYSELLAPMHPAVCVPTVPSGARSAWAQYSVLAASGPSRQALQRHLAERGVPTAVYYPRPLHLQPAFQHLGYRQGDFPVAEDCSSRIFSLPMHPHLSRQDQERIVAAIGEAVREK